MSPTLSICIPTKNRCGELYFTLKSIVEQKYFQETNEVEIVISDNNSDDFTPQIVEIFKNQYPDKIVYNRNEIDILDENFEKVLRCANGKLLKLHNDNFIFKDNILETVVNKIKNLEEEKPMIFFANQNSPLGKDFLCNDLNDLIKSASFLITWIASFSVWKSDIDKYDNFAMAADKGLIQTELLIKTLTQNINKVYVYNDRLFEGFHSFYKGGYNIAKVFGENYLSLLKPCLINNDLDKKIYENEKKYLLLNHIIRMKFYTATKEEGWVFKNNGGYWNILFHFYWYNLYFYTSIFKIIPMFIEAKINFLFKKIFLTAYQKYWRKRNFYNETTVEKGLNISKIHVGKNVKGHIYANFTSDPNEVLIIDDNVIIPDGTVYDFDQNKLQIIRPQ